MSEIVTASSHQKPRWQSLFYLIAFATGAAGLIYEILWNRYLLLILGSTTYATAGILAVFIGGLALGSFWGVSIARRHARPLLLYVVLQASIALYAQVLVSVLQYLNQGGLLASQLSPGVARIAMLAAYVSLLLPTIAMGASFPLLVLARRLTAGDSEKAPALFYGWDTLGATLGALAAGFFLIPSLGMQASLWVGVSLSLFAVVIALVIQERIHLRHRATQQNKSAVPMPAPSRAIVIAILLAGIASFGYEIVWTRVLVLIIGSSTYAFTITVTVFILGTALGSLLISRHLHRFRAPLEVFIHTQIGIAVLAFLTLYLYGQMPGFYMQLVSGYENPAAIFAAQIFVAALIMLPATLLVGASFPLAVQILDQDYAAQEKSFGVSFALISAGNVVGVFLTILFLIPLLGLQKSTIALGLTNMFSALVLLLALTVIRGRQIIILIVSTIALAAVLFPPRWDSVLMTSGVYAKLPVYRKLAGSEEYFRNLLKLYRMKFYKESIENVVSVVEMPTVSDLPYYALAVDGKVDASTGDADMGTQLLSGHLPFVLGRDPQDVLVIGLASGITLGAVGLHPVEQITAVEIEPAMREAAAVFRDLNHGILDDPRVDLVFDDGRHYLNTTRHRYDLIISEPSNPWMSGPSRLFTKGFYEVVRSRLTSEGLFVQWAPLYGMGKPHFTSLIRTYLEVFSHTIAFRVSDGDLLLIGGNTPIEISVSRLATLFNNEEVRRDLERVGAKTPGALLARWVGATGMLRQVSREAVVNTDDNGYIEFGAPRFLYQNTIPENLSLLETQQTGLALLRQIRWDVSDSSREALLVDLAEQAIEEGRGQLVQDLIGYLNQQGDQSASFYLSGRVAESRGDWLDAIDSYEKMADSYPLSGRVIGRLLWLYVRTNRLERAEAALRGLSSEMRQGEYDYWRGYIHLRAGKPEVALSYFLKLETSEVTKTDVLYHLYTFLAAARARGALQSSQYERHFRQSLGILRRKAEMDQALAEIQKLINQFELDKSTWLTRSEQEKLERIIVEELLSPLNLYNKGLNALFVGRFEEAEGPFGRVLALLSDKDPATKATYFLDLIHNTAIAEGSE